MYLEGGIGFFGFAVLVTFEIGFSVFALKVTGFGIHCGFRFLPFLHSGFDFYEQKKKLLGFCYSLLF